MKKRRNRLITFCLAGGADNVLAVTHHLSLFKSVPLDTFLLGLWMLWELLKSPE